MASVSEYVFLEAIVIGAAFVISFFMIHWVAMKFVGEAAMMNHAYLAVQVFITAALFHIVCEYTGLNAWYCDNRNKID